MRTVAVVAHAGKGPEGGLMELRQVLAREGVADPLWCEVTKSRKAAKRARGALAQGAEVLFVWGGDGTVQRCIDAVAGTQAVLAILPAGTANLLASNLRIPADLTEAVQVGLYGWTGSLAAARHCTGDKIEPADWTLSYYREELADQELFLAASLHTAGPGRRWPSLLACPDPLTLRDHGVFRVSCRVQPGVEDSPAGGR